MTPGDLEAVVGLEAATASAWGRNLVAEELVCTNSIQRVATAAGNVIGWCCCRIIGEEAELLKIAVGGEYRRRGIATALLLDAEQQLCRVGARRLYLEVRRQNQAARRFYQANGFSEEGRRRAYYSRPSDDAVLLAKTIQRP